MSRWIVPILIAMVGAAARADTGLYWCSAETYLAYDVPAAGKGDARRHELHVVRFGSSEKYPSGSKVQIPIGEIRSLMCSPGEIAVFQYEKTSLSTSTFKEYHYGVEEDVPKLTLARPLANLGDIDGRELRRLWAPQGDDGKPVDELVLTSSGYKLVYQKIGGVHCGEKIERKVFLRPPTVYARPDFLISEYNTVLDCGE